MRAPHLVYAAEEANITLPNRRFISSGPKGVTRNLQDVESRQGRANELYAIQCAQIPTISDAMSRGIPHDGRTIRLRDAPRTSREPKGPAHGVESTPKGDGNSPSDLRRRRRLVRRCSRCLHLTILCLCIGML